MSFLLEEGRSAELFLAVAVWTISSVGSLLLGSRLLAEKEAALKGTKPALTWQQRFNAMDKVLLGPFFLVVGVLSVYASYELRGTVASRWVGSTRTSRFVSELYSIKMATDLPLLLLFSKDPTKMVQMLLHHVLSLVSIVGGLVNQRLQFYASLALCSELTTVFLNTVFCLKLLGDPAKSQNQQKVLSACGVLLWASYIPFRLALFPYWLWMFHGDVTDNQEATWDIITPFERYFYPGTILLLLLLSLSWFRKISRGLFGLLWKPTDVQTRQQNGHPQPEKEEENGSSGTNNNHDLHHRSGNGKVVESNGNIKEKNNNGDGKKDSNGSSRRSPRKPKITKSA